ncbi:hypothetical protein [Actinomadura opuntiae]|uniref:hypothetical protein n=1 Tax=Actinomadura sp. OS1-43 TaxID=604315 RepID=UPI00255AEA19|nr:hypothetical protein [Actinomadura sp. OS1-43]MDL4816083.1 hypothetical protein [Actinomadura sp. OS1-43]
MTGRVGARGLAVLAAAPLLGAAQLPAAHADGPGPSGGKGQHGHKDGHHAKAEGHAKGEGHAKPHKRPVKHRKPSRSVRLHTSGPGKTLIPGRTYDWPFAVTAKGPGKAGPAVFRATLPKSLEFVSGRRDCAAGGWTVECDLGAVSPGETVAGMIRAKVSRSAKPDEVLRIPAAVTWRSKRAAADFPVARVARTADLVVSKTAPATARAGSPIPYAMKVRNRGPATAENVFVHASGPVRLLAGNVACIPEDTGFVCGVGSLRPGETRTLRFKVMPAGNVRAGKVLRYRSRVTSSTMDLNPRNNTASVRTRLTAEKAPSKKAPSKKAPSKKSPSKASPSKQKKAGSKKHAPKHPSKKA